MGFPGKRSLSSVGREHSPHKREVGFKPGREHVSPLGVLIQSENQSQFTKQVSVREDMRPFFRILKTTIYMIKRNQAWFWKIFRAIKSITIFTFRMVLATVLGLMSIVSIFAWYDKPFNIHLLILGIISVFIVVHQIVIMTYESEK